MKIITLWKNINLSQKQKNSIANDITNTHSKFTGANTFFAQVIFQKNQKNSHFMGGKLVKTKEIFLNGQIRAGRTSKVKKIYNIFKKNIGNLPEKTSFAVAVSGGPDSLALSYLAKCYSLEKKNNR